VVDHQLMLRSAGGTWDGCQTKDAMRLERHARCLFIPSVAQQRAYVATVVDLHGLLRRRRVVAGRGGLQHEAVNSSEDKQLADQIRHRCGGALGVSGSSSASARRSATRSCSA
jgi:hypothetical protein